jgi:hypothetical protein
MKNLLLALTLITLTFLSGCKKEDDTPPSPTPNPPNTTLYEGTYRGTYTGDSQGTSIVIVSGTGQLTGTYMTADSTSWGDKYGTITESGVFREDFQNGGFGIGQFDAVTDTYTGTWSNASGSKTGTSSGTKD